MSYVLFEFTVELHACVQKRIIRVFRVKVYLRLNILRNNNTSNLLHNIIYKNRNRASNADILQYNVPIPNNIRIITQERSNQQVTVIV